MLQTAPDPQILESLVDRLAYKDGWRFDLKDMDRGQGSKGLTLVITITGPNSYDSEERISVAHLMLVPPAAYNEGSWRHWLFDQIGLVELHERMEWFKIDGLPAYAPNHGHGEDPYIVHDPTTDEARRTSFRNVLDDDGTGRPKSPPVDLT